METNKGKLAQKINRIKPYVAVVFMLFALAAAAFTVYKFITTEKESLGGSTIAQQIIKDMKINTITYYYTDTIFLSEPEEWKLFGLWDIDPGVRYLAVQYDGVIRLGIDFGIDAKNLMITEQGLDASGKTILKIVIPEVIEISHEQFRNDEVTIFQDGKYTSKEVSRALLNKAYEDRKHYYSESAVRLGLHDEARENAISQINNLLYMIPAIKEHYTIQWE